MKGAKQDRGKKPVERRPASGNTSGLQRFDAKFDTLARLVRKIAINRGHADQALVDALFAAGWTKANLVDATVVIGEDGDQLSACNDRVPVDVPVALQLSA